MILAGNMGKCVFNLPYFTRSKLQRKLKEQKVKLQKLDHAGKWENRPSLQMSWLHVLAPSSTRYMTLDKLTSLNFIFEIDIFLEHRKDTYFLKREIEDLDNDSI